LPGITSPARWAREQDISIARCIWAPGAEYAATGLTELLFLFKDPNDADPGVEVALPPDVWDLISQILLRELLGIPSVQQAVERLGAGLVQSRQ
jgi:hypothetical protein